MSDDFKMQLSICIPSGEQFEKGHMLNIRANDPDEFQAMLGWATDHADKIGEAVREVKAVAVVADGLGGSTIRHESNDDNTQGPRDSSGWGSSGSQNRSSGGSGQQNRSQGQNRGGSRQQQTPPPHVGPAPSCIHGTKTYLRKPYKNGNPGYWEAWACPSQDRNDQCGLDFIPKGN